MVNEGESLYNGLKYLFSKGKTPKSSTTIMNTITSNAFFSSVATCEGALEAGQLFIGNCDPPVLDGIKFTDNINCKLCKQQKIDLYNQRIALESKAKEEDPNYTIQTFSNTITQTEWENDNSSTNSCKFVCSSCLFLKNEQSVQLRLLTQCSDDIDSQTQAFIDTMNNNLADETSKVMDAYATQLNNIGIDTSEQVKNLTKTDISERILTKITSNQTVSMLSLFKNAAVAFQSTIIEPGSNSIISTNNVQMFNLDSVFFAVQQSKVGVNLYNDENYTTFVKQFEREDKLNDIVKQATEAGNSLKNLWQNDGGKVLIILLVVMLIVIIVSVGVTYLRKG
jgi:hypothetical protein